MRTTPHFRVGHTAAPDWESAAHACLRQLDSGTAAAPSTLGFLYLTDRFAPHAGRVVEFLRAGTGVEHWVGTVGVGVCSAGIEYFDEPAMVALTARLPTDSFRVFSTISGEFRAFEAAHGAWCRDRQPHFGVVHADPRNGKVASLVEELSRRLGGGFLVGGVSSSRAAQVQLADGVTDGGLSGVLFSPEVAVATRLTQGCSPIGGRHTITACEGNLLVTLDGAPALEVLLREAGEVLAGHPERLAGHVFVALPVRGSDTGDYLVRNLIGLDPRHGVVAIGDLVEPGGQVVFCRRDPPSAEQDLRRMLRALAATLTGPPRGGVYHTCLARGPNLFGAGSAELKIIEEELGSFPLAGFFGNGEISHDRLYAYTGVLTLFP